MSALAVAFAASAHASPPPTLPGSVQPGRDRPLPTPPPPKPGYRFRIEAPHRSPIPRDVDTIHFKLSGIRIVGAKTIPAARFRHLYAKLIGTQITLSNIYDVADAIEATYRAAGYPLVRAYVPPQRVSDGVFTIRVVEGHVAALAVEGGTPDLQARIRAYLAPAVASRPLKLDLIERGLLLSNDMPGVKASGILKPSASVPGASDLVVTADEPRIAGGIATDNRGSHFSGIWTVTANARVNGVFDGEDSLFASLVASPHSFEQIGGQVRYSHPLFDDGLRASLVGVVTHGQPGSTLSAFNVRTDSYAFGTRLSYPIIRSRAESLIVDGGVTVQNAKVDILSLGISHDNWRVIDVAASYLNNDILGGSFAGTLDVAQGLPVLGATHDSSADLSRRGAKTDFTKFVGSARYFRPLIDGFSAMFAMQGQYAFSPMITGEQITFGGRQIGRGYDPGAVTGDRGVGGSAELRYDRRFADLHPLLRLEPYVFYDTAATWFDNHGASFDPSLKNETIASTGAGVRFWFDYNFTADVEVAHTLRAVPGSDSGSKTTKVLVDAAIRF